MSSPLLLDSELQRELSDDVTFYAAGTTLRMFQNNFTPLQTSVLGDFVEATYSGYAAVDISAEWSVPAKNGSSQWYTETDPHSFLHSGGAVDNTIYGWFVEDSLGNVIFARRFDAPIVMTAGSLGFSIQVQRIDENV